MNHPHFFLAPDSAMGTGLTLSENINTNTAAPIRLEIAAFSVLDSAHIQNHTSVLQSVTIINPTAEPLENVMLQISADPALCAPASIPVDFVPANSVYEVKDALLFPDDTFWSALTEPVTGVLWFTLTKDTVTLCATCIGVTCVNTLDSESENLLSPASPQAPVPPDDDLVEAEANISKKTLWERKLLDLGLRNTLINMRMSKTMIPILTSALDEVENVLSSGSDFSVSPRPIDWHIPAGELGFENMHDMGTSVALIQSEFKARRLRSSLGESELGRTIRELYRSSKTVMEENGSNTLYLALGLLRWFENDRSTKPHYAPIVLLPVELIRKSAALGYVIRLRDDEPQMNITMLEKLKQDFDIVIHGLDPLPQDSSGIDIRRVLTVIRKSILCQPRWAVLESAYLGIFSFSQFVMWNDIRNRSDDLVQNKVVHSLMEGHLTWDAEPIEIGDRVSEEDILMPLPADASQLYAIQAACRGESFVLHGPPGTGKSQTITALIANALAQDKTVLFVAEKMAALEVVQKRLTAIGIEPFCLELHSNKAKKKTVLEQLSRATEVTRFTTAEEYAHRAEQLATLRAELDAYAEALHRALPYGMTVHELIDRCEAVRSAPDLRAFDVDFAERVDQTQLEQHVVLLERLVAAAKAVTHPQAHPLQVIGCTQYSQHLRTVLPHTLQQYRTALQTLQTAACAFAEAIGECGPFQYDQLERLAAIAKELAFWATCPRAWSTTENTAHYMHEVRKMARHFMAADAQYRILTENWTDGILNEDGAALLAQWKQANEKWFLPRALGMHKLKKYVAPYMKQPIEPETFAVHFAALTEYQAEKAAADRLFEQYGPDLGDWYTEMQTDWAQIQTQARTASNSTQQLQMIPNAEQIRRQVGGIRSLSPIIDAMNTAWADLAAPRQTVYELLALSFAPTDDWLAQQFAACDRIESHRDEIKEWVAWNAAAADCRAVGLQNVIAAYENGMAHADILPAYQKATLNTLIMHAIDRCPALNSFSGAVFNEKIEQLKRLDQEMITVAQKEIFCRLAAKVPNFTREAVQSSEIGILQRAIRSGGRGISIRRLFESIPNLLPRLCPCMLMSPISAAQYLDPKREPFSIVVFDEASQLPTGKAVGALARGHNAVIVGDPKQMPPTSFFATNMVDEENFEVEDLESILDDCLAMNMPQTHLLWHYRSRHESLIAFSNHRFYENKLYTFPSVNDRDSKVHTVHVNGVFDRGQTRQNLAEAEAVVKELQRRSHDDVRAKYSVGVVTFNIAQQNLIDDLLTEACKTDPVLEAWTFETEEPIFIKNLENVQGDERDVILFSVGYGPDESGRVYMNFGPLNRAGGWRRLNVAVSRARVEMMVFTSLTAEQIDLSRSTSEGVAALKGFLEYADGMPLPQTDESLQVSIPGHGITDTICKFLHENGYETDRAIGHSAFRVDIGVLEPNNPQQYLLGILLDGATYRAAKTTRDREITHLNVLNGLGWRILRVWTMDWWENRRKVLAQILTELQHIQNHPEASIEEPAALPVGVPEWAENAAQTEPKTEAETPYPAIPYSPTPLRKELLTMEAFLAPQTLPVIQKRITAVIRHESPVGEPFLMRRVAQSLGFTRVTPIMKEYFEKVLASMHLKYTLEDDGTRFYWKRGLSPANYTSFRVGGSDDCKRDPRDVMIKEAANAVYRVLYDQISLSEIDLIREAAKQMGFQRLSASVIGLIAHALRYAKRKKRIVLSTNGNWMLRDSAM